MSYETPACPICGTALSHSDGGDFNPWVCPQGHGMAATLTEGYERIDGEELRELWQRARSDRATVGPRACPMCARTMVVAGAPAKTAGGGEVPVDVCTTDELLWFDNSELDALPVATEAPPAPPEEQAHLEEIMQRFDSGLDVAFEARERDGLLHRMADRVSGNSHLLGSLAAGGREVERAD